MIHFEGKMKQTKQNKKYFIPNTYYTFSQFWGYKKVVHLQVQVRLLLTSKVNKIVVYPPLPNVRLRYLGLNIQNKLLDISALLQ